MITITRKLAHTVRAVFRRALGVTTSARGPHVYFDATRDGILIRARHNDFAVERFVAGDFCQDSLAIPFQALADCEGRRDEPVTFERRDDNILVNWTDGHVPQLVTYDEPDREALANFPQVPAQLTENSPELLQALHNASETADDQSVRFALGSVQLQAEGAINATDSRHMLAQYGFQFGWESDALVPRTAVFSSTELAGQTPVAIGRNDDWVTLRVGSWTFHLAIVKEVRFPDVADYIRSQGAAVASVKLSDNDAVFLAEALKRLPGIAEFNQPVTVDVNGQVAIRAKSDKQPQMTELVLTNSQATGEALRFNTNRRFLARAMKLGFREVWLYGTEQPAICRDATRVFVWALLGNEGALKPHRNAIRIESPADAGADNSNSTPLTRKSTNMRKNKTAENGAAPAATATTEINNGQPQPSETVTRSPIEQAIALRNSLREAANQTNELVRLLKRQQKKSQLVQSTLASLKQLQTIDA